MTGASGVSPTRRARSPSPKPIRHAVEYAGVRIGLGLLGLLSPQMSSGLMGAMFARLGPRSTRTARAATNLDRVFPDISDADKRRIIERMWRNFGRVMGEYPHLRDMLADPSRVRFEGLDEVRAVLGDRKAALLVSAHYGNWEMTTAAGRQVGLTQANLYRPASNRWADDYLLKLREPTASGGFIEKGDSSVRDIMRALKRGVSVGLLVDQREPRGISVPFLGVEAKTAHTPALIAKRMGVPVFVGRARRMSLSGPDATRFVVETRHVPIPETGDPQADILAATTAINDLFSQWIIEDPEQWLWYHKRFADRTYKS